MSMSSPRTLVLAVGGMSCVLDRQQHRSRFECSGGAEGVTGHPLGRHDRYRAGPEDVRDRGGLGGVVERCARAVRVDLLDVGRLEAGVVERQLHAGDRPDAAWRRRGDVVGVGVARAAEDLADDRRAARHWAASHSSSTNAAAPSPMTKPSRSASNGRLVPVLDSAVMLPKPASEVGVPACSVPPVTTASASPHAISRAA
jgi:hypothetical protein